MLIQLPVEIWIEILDSLRRHDLIKKLDKLWDRQFTPIVQDWLHKYTRNVKIGTLWANNDGLNVRSSEYEQWEKVPFAIVDMPGNIVGFERINISYMDSNMLAFLRRMRPLFRDICLDIDTKNQTALRLLMPMFNSNNSSIKALTLDCDLLPFFSTNHPATFFNVKFLRAWNYASDYIEPMVTWLFTLREDSQPRLLWLSYVDTDFYEKILERFLHPARHCVSPFFVRFFIVPGSGSPNSTSVTENARTGEQLFVQQYVDKGYGLITNYSPHTVNPEWLANNTAESLNWDWGKQDRVIWLFSPEIGPFNGDDEKSGTSQTKAAKRMHPADDDEDEEEVSSRGGEATSSTGVKRKKLMSDPKEKEKKKANEEETKGLRRSERIKEMKQSKKY